MLLKVLLIAGLVPIAIVLVLAMVRAFRTICAPNEILVKSGGKRKLADGRTVGYTVFHGGPVWRWPLIHKVDRMTTTVMSINVNTDNAYSKGGIPLIVQAIANVKISTDTKMVGNVVERFLEQPRSYLLQVAQETLEGHLRGVLATMTPEEVNEDRLKFAEKLTNETSDDFAKLGLQLDVFKIQNVSDERDYLSNVGRELTAEVIRDAEIAESNCHNEAEQRSAECEGRGKVAQENAERTIAQKKNELRRIEADLEAKAKSEEERAEQAAEEARADAEQKLQEIRSQLEELRLNADTVIPAEISKQARQLEADGEAAAIAEDGKAHAEVLSSLNDTWRSAGSQAGEIFLMRQLDDVLEPVLDSVKKVTVDETAVVDSGDGKSISAYLAAYPQAVLEILERLGQATGVELTALAAGRTNGAAAVAAGLTGTSPGAPGSGTSPAGGPSAKGGA